MRLFRKNTHVCQNCRFGNNEKGKWKKTLFYYTGIIDDNGKKDKRHWHIFCEKKQKYYFWNKYKRCFIKKEIELVNTSEPLYMTDKNSITLKYGEQLDWEQPVLQPVLKDAEKTINQYLRPYNPKATKKEQKKLDKMIDKIPKKEINELINKVDKQQKAENIINQFRGYFQAEEDELIKDNSMRMLDELEMILKS